MTKLCAAACAAALAGFAALPGLADAAFPGTNGKIVYQVGDTGKEQLYSINPDGTCGKQLAATQDPVVNRFPSVSGDGRTIVFDRETRSGARIVTADIFAMNAAGTDVRQITNTPDLELAPAVSRDGGKIAFESGGPVNIFTTNADGSGTTQLTSETSYPSHDKSASWSPDGTRILFAHMGQEPGTGFQIWVMNADGSAQTQLTTQGGDEPVFSPDGTRIAFRRTIGPERDGIVVANADDSGETVIAPPPGFFFMAPAFSPDGTKILASMIPLGQDRHQLVTMNPDGSDRQAVGIPDDVLFPSGTWAPAVAGDDGSCTKATAVAGSSNAGSTVAAPDGGVTVAAVVEGCGRGPCTYSSVATVAPSVAGARAAAKRAVVIGSGKLKLATGRTSPVKLRLGAAGRKLLVKKKTLKVTVTVTGKDARHKTVKKVARVKITAPKKS